MAVLIFLMTFLGAAWSPAAVARPLRIWGRRIQVVAALVMIVVGAALLYAGVNDHVWDDLILGGM